MPEKKQKNRGFTIIETLVAITILLIAIVGPLTFAEKGLTEAVSSQDRLTASYLAQDLMEYVKNVRDDNLLASVWWLDYIDVNPSGTVALCEPGRSYCDFDTLVQSAAFSPNQTLCKGSPQGLCQLYLTPTGYYSSDYTIGGTSLTKFSRTYTITTPPGISVATATSSLVTVTVAWKTGNVSDQIVLQDIIFDTSR